MSINCLKTKLKVSVSNSNLPIFNTIVFQPNAAGEYSGIRLAGQEVILDVEDGTLKYTSSGNVISTPFTMDVVSSTNLTFVANSSNSKLIVRNKYELLDIFDMAIDLSMLACCTKIATLGTYSGKLLYGSISNLKTLVGLQKVDFSTNTKVHGDIAVLGKLPLIHTLGFRASTNLHGTVESVIAGLINGGRTSAMTKEAGIVWTSTNTNVDIKFNDDYPTTNGYFLWEAGETAGQYVITYKSSSDDSTISSRTITV